MQLLGESLSKLVLTTAKIMACLLQPPNLHSSVWHQSRFTCPSWDLMAGDLFSLAPGYSLSWIWYYPLALISLQPNLPSCKGERRWVWKSITCSPQCLVMLGIFSACCVMGALSDQSPLEFEQGGDRLWREQMHLPFIEDLPSSTLYSLFCMQTALYMKFLCSKIIIPFSGNEIEFQEGYMTCPMSYHL